MEELKERIKKVKEKFPNAKTALIQALHEVRWKYGYIKEEAIPLVAEVLGIPEGEVKQVASFYSYFKFKPVGKFHFRLCTNITCMLHGSYNVLEHLKKKLGIGPGEVTPDGLFSYEEAECLGCGRKPPVMLVNDTRFEGVTPELVDEIIEKARKGELKL